MDIIPGRYSMTYLQWMCQRANQSNYNMHLLFDQLKEMKDRIVRFNSLLYNSEARLDADFVEEKKQDLKPFINGVDRLKKEIEIYDDAYNYLQGFDHEADKRIISASTRIFCQAPLSDILTFLTEATIAYVAAIVKLESKKEERESLEQ